MAASTIDGTVETADIKRQNKMLHQYRTLRFKLDSGGERVISNAVVDNVVAARLQPGAAGRFYLFDAFDVKGVYAYRDALGQSVAGYPGQNEKLGLIAIGIGLVALVLFGLFSDGIPVIVFVGIGLGALGLFLTRSARLAVERLFAADNAAAVTTAKL